MIVPPWTIGWRLRRSLAWAGLNQQQIADELGVSRMTVQRWLHDGTGTPPRRAFLRAWADICGVSLDWLIDGEERGCIGSTLGIDERPSEGLLVWAPWTPTP